MRLPDEPGFPVLPPGQPTRDLLLAQALDACITAERRLPGSAQEIIARQPAWARADLQRLIGLAGSLDAAASNAIMSSEFRVAARARLMRRIGGDSAQAHLGLGAGSGSPPDGAAREDRTLGLVRLSTVSADSGPHPAPRLRWAWARRATASLVSAVLAIAATLTAAASALPGEPLYRLKQTQEELGVRLAPDDQQRTLALLRQANARLDETTRLLQQGRTADATATTLSYDQVVQRAAMMYVGTIDDTPTFAPATVNMEASLIQNQDQLQALLQFAPEPAQADLREALVATERGRALVADPRPVEQALGRSDSGASALAAPVPTMAAEDSPTVVPTVVVEEPTALPTRGPALVLVPPTSTPAAVVVAGTADHAGPSLDVAQIAGADRADRDASSAQVLDQTTTGDPGRLAALTQPARSTGNDHSRGSNQHVDNASVSPTVVAHADAPDTPDPSADVEGHASSTSDGQSHTVDRPDLAVQLSGRTGGGGDSHAVAGVQGQDDPGGRGLDVAPPIAARQPIDPAAGVVASDGHGGTTVRNVSAVVVVGPERTTGGSTHISTNTSTSTSVNSTTDHPAHDISGDAHVSNPQVAGTTTKPQTGWSTTALAASPAGTPATTQHGGDGDSTRVDRDSTQRSSTTTSATTVTATHTFSDTRSSVDNHSVENHSSDGRRPLIATSGHQSGDGGY